MKGNILQETKDKRATRKERALKTFGKDKAKEINKRGLSQKD